MDTEKFTNITVIVDTLLEQSGLELANDPKGNKLTTLSYKLTQEIYQSDADIELTELVDNLKSRLPPSIRDDDDWVELLEQLADSVMEIVESNTDELTIEE